MINLGAFFLTLIVLCVIGGSVTSTLARYPSEYIYALRCPNAKCAKPLEAPGVLRGGRYDTIRQTQISLDGRGRLCPHCGQVFLDTDDSKNVCVGHFRRFNWEWKD